MVVWVIIVVLLFPLLFCGPSLYADPPFVLFQPMLIVRPTLCLLNLPLLVYLSLGVLPYLVASLLCKAWLRLQEFQADFSPNLPSRQSEEKSVLGPWSAQIMW